MVARPALGLTLAGLAGAFFPVVSPVVDFRVALPAAALAAGRESSLRGLLLGLTAGLGLDTCRLAAVLRALTLEGLATFLAVAFRVAGFFRAGLDSRRTLAISNFSLRLL